jgi:DNA mismatch repair protein MutL
MGGGIDSIEVHDNGTGISPDDLPLLFIKHATSKINSIEDLLITRSMGFRGEALYSIQAVSRVTVQSNAGSDGTSPGREITNHGEEAGKVKQVSCTRGTMVRVEDIFHNLPVRRKFLVSATGEWTHIKKVIAWKALAFRNIQFIVTNNGKKVFSTAGDGQFEQAFFTIYSKEDHFVTHAFKRELTDDIVVEVFHSPPEHFFTSRKYQLLFVNGRPISVSFFYSAVDNAIRRYVSPGRHPMVLVYLVIPPDMIDINIHPAKKEIRFHGQSRIYNAIMSAVEHSFSSQLERTLVNSSINTVLAKEATFQKRCSLSGNPGCREGLSAETHLTKVKFSMVISPGWIPVPVMFNRSNQNSLPRLLIH